MTQVTKMPSAHVPLTGTEQLYLVQAGADCNMTWGTLLQQIVNPGSPVGTVTSVATGAGLSGGPITTSGTIVAQWQGGTVVTLGTGLALNAGTLTARQSARMQISWASGAVVTNDTVYFVYDAPYPGTINSMTHFCTTGSFTVAVKIAGTNVTGLAAVSPTSTPTTTNATAANAFTAGQIISGVITSAASSPTDALLSLNVTWAA